MNTVTRSILMAIGASAIFLTGKVVAGHPVEPDFFTIAATTGDLNKLGVDELKYLRQLASGEEVNGLRLKKNYIRCGGKMVYDLFDPKLDLSAMHMKVSVKSYVGSPSGLVDDLSKLGVKIVNDPYSYSLTGAVIASRDDRTRVEVHEFTGSVRELLLMALPRTYSLSLWRLYPSYKGRHLFIRFGGPINGTPTVSTRDFLPASRNELRLENKK